MLSGNFCVRPRIRSLTYVSTACWGLGIHVNPPPTSTLVVTFCMYRLSSVRVSWVVDGLQFGDGYPNTQVIKLIFIAAKQEPLWRWFRSRRMRRLVGHILTCPSVKVVQPGSKVGRCSSETITVATLCFKASCQRMALDKIEF